jgi:hypothetical protein
MKTAIFASAVLAIVGVGLAQYPYDGYYPPYYEGHASTAGEGYARGMADIISSAGQANLMNSEAAKNYEDARKKNIENHLTYTNTYFEMRRQNREARAAESSGSLSQDQLYRIAAEAAPKRPSASKLDPITGQINWPIILRDPRYEEGTKRLDELFAQRAAKQGSIGANTYREIEPTCDALLQELKANIKDYSGTDYAPAKNLLEGLAYEARFPIRI